MPLLDKIKKFGKSIYDKLVKIDDSPQRVALGFGLGVFCGILPGTGPVASLVVAFIFRVNKVAALTGSLLTNTWLSIVTFLAAVKLGSAVVGADWNEVYVRCKEVIRNFDWKELSAIPFTEILLPLLIGYLVVGLISGAVAYGIAILIMRRRQAGNVSPNS